MSTFDSTHDASSPLSTRGSYSSLQGLDRVPAAEAAQQETPLGPSLEKPADPCPQEPSLARTTHCPPHVCIPAHAPVPESACWVQSSSRGCGAETWPRLSWVGTVRRGLREPQAPEHLRHPSFWTPWATMLSSKRDGHWGRAGQPESTHHRPTLWVAIRSGT